MKTRVLKEVQSRITAGDIADLIDFKTAQRVCFGKLTFYPATTIGTKASVSLYTEGGALDDLAREKCENNYRTLPYFQKALVELDLFMANARYQDEKVLVGDLYRRG